MLSKGPSDLPLAIWKQATHKSERPWCTTKNGTGGLLQIIKCQMITFAKETKSKKLLFQELSYHGVNIIFYTHGQFNNLYLPTEKYSERLVCVFHDLDLFSLNVNSNIDPYYNAFYKITKIIRALWLAKRRKEFSWEYVNIVVMSRCFAFLHANHASTNLKKVLNWKTRQVYFTYPFSHMLKLEKSLETCYVNLLSLELTF